MDEKNKHIEIRNEEVQDILSRPPHNLIRWGSSCIGLIFLIIFVGSFLFSFPDTISCEITVTTSNPPIWILSKTTGKIKEIYKLDKQQVKQEDIIAVIENSADTKEVIRLKNIITRINIDNVPISNINSQSVNLGDIQSTYTSFVKAIDKYNNSIKYNLYINKIITEKTQLSAYSNYLAMINRQIFIGYKQLQINTNEYKRDDNLYNKNLISKSDLEIAEKLILSNKMSIEQIRSTISNTKVQIAQSYNNIQELRLQQYQENKENETSILSTLNELKNAIRTWEQNYVLISPITGILSYNNIWKINQNVTIGDKVFSVISKNKGHLIGKMKLPIAGSGKVKIGQKVNIKLDSYPYLEYGYLAGRIASISTLAENNVYTATVIMPKDLETSYHKSINFVGDLTGTAEIITNNMSIGERIIYPLKYLYHKNLTQ